MGICGLTCFTVWNLWYFCENADGNTILQIVKDGTTLSAEKYGDTEQCLLRKTVKGFELDVVKNIIYIRV